MHKIKQSSIPWQGSMLHSATSVSEPLQYCPPLSGRGLAHARLRCIVPLPQETLHSVQFSQIDQPPSTTLRKKNK